MTKTSFVVTMGLVLTATAVLGRSAGAQAAPPPGTYGVTSGSLTPGETAHLEHREQRINQQVRTDRADNGGKMTPAERAKINREQNRTSGAIYRDKHNARTQPR
jgi:hypothetical protein